eukprot:6185495-Pleurochrysis_carterae.AAC.1
MTSEDIHYDLGRTPQRRQHASGMQNPDTSNSDIRSCSNEFNDALDACASSHRCRCCRCALRA